MYLIRSLRVSPGFSGSGGVRAVYILLGGVFVVVVEVGVWEPGTGNVDACTALYSSC